MSKNISYTDARDLLLKLVSAVETERVALENCTGRVLAQDIAAQDNVPPFDRSPYDGYAFTASDTAAAARENPVTLRILEEIPAGAEARFRVVPGTAAKVLTGAPIPEGADAVCKFEDTSFTSESVTMFSPYRSGDNIVYTGEDVKAGELLARMGTVIDPGLAGTLAAQNMTHPLVYRRARVGIISTGSELVEAGSELEAGKIYNSNRYTFTAALEKLGCIAEYIGTAGDSAEEISRLISEGLERCSALILTGGVSVGDYDMTPAAMELSGVDILFRGVDLKPGMACAYGVKNSVPVCALSGNPASSVTNFYAVAYPAIRRLCGFAEALPREITVTLDGGFRKKSPATRILRGVLELSDGTARMRLVKDQGNVILSSTIGCNVMAVVPAGSGPLESGMKLKGFMI